MFQIHLQSETWELEIRIEVTTVWYVLQAVMLTSEVLRRTVGSLL